MNLRLSIISFKQSPASTKLLVIRTVCVKDSSSYTPCSLLHFVNHVAITKINIKIEI